MSGAPSDLGKRTRWFWGNLVALLVLLPFATYWFQRHLRPYFTQILIVGGTFTLWALVRMLWGLFEKATDFHAWDHSRKVLSTSGTTRLIVVAALALLVLWCTTSSIYFEYAGGGSADSEYVLRVLRKKDGSAFLDDIFVNSSHPVAGRPLFWQGSTLELVCRVLRPVRYETLDCKVVPRQSTRVAVPQGFTQKEFHLLRLVPSHALYPELPDEADRPVVRYDLKIARGKKTQIFKDLRRQTLYVGADGDDEMALILGLENPEAFERFLVSRLRAAQLDPESASQMAAVLVSNTKPWPAIYLRKDDQISVTVTCLRSEAGHMKRAVVEGFPVVYTVTDDKVQTLWLPSK